jgi:predicted RNA-binding protein with EMAP domain
MADTSNYKVGVVVKMELCGSQRSNSKALKACTVNIGGETTVTVVTSASNVREGSRYVMVIL